MMKSRVAQVALSLGMMWGATACDGCDDPGADQPDGGAQSCSMGEVHNPITGLCQRVDKDDLDMNGPPTDLSLDMGGDGTNDRLDLGPEMRPLPDMRLVEVDVGPDDRCKRGLDSDSDGLDNACECTLNTDPGSSDTDGDGLPDGYEDANGNCRTDGLETQPTVADTDSDGISDGDEVNAGLDPLNFDTDSDGLLDGVEYQTCLDPTKADTDDDGIEDGVEDANQDGKIGICPDRMYAASCAQGEYDPCKADTDGDGEPDGQEVNFLSCRQEFLDAIPAPTLLSDLASDFKMAIAPQAQSAAVAGSAAYAFNHPQASYAGFVSPVTVAVSDVEQMRDLLLNRVRTQYPNASFDSTGRRTSTHEGFEAVTSIRIDLGSAGRPDTGRDFALQGLLSSGSVSHGLAGTFATSGDNLVLVAGIVQQSTNVFLVTGAVASRSVYGDRAASTGYLMDDVTGSGNIASFDEEIESACVAYRVDDRPRADFIWIIDGSGSMSEENDSVKNYADEFVQILTASNLDWRLGVVSSNCDNITADLGVPAEVRGLFGGSGLSADCPAFPNVGFTPYRYKNGMLCAENNAFFTQDPQKFKACIQEMGRPTGGSVITPAAVTEYTVTMAPAAIGRALPRSETNISKLRPDAATIVISVTDEFDDLIERKMGWADAGSGNNLPNDPTTDPNFDSAGLDMLVQPFVDYMSLPESLATVFGIYWVPGQTCSTASEAAAGIDRVVSKTGGTAGNICSGNIQTTLAAIAQASAGLASGLRVEGAPLPSTLGVRRGNVQTQLLELPPRSRQQGWDYDAVTNAVSFFGTNPPQTSDRVVITYKRWKNSLFICTSDSDCGTGAQKAQCIDGTCR